MQFLKGIFLTSVEATINFYYVHFKKDFYDRHHLDVSWDENGLKVEWLNHEGICVVQRGRVESPTS